MAPPKHKRSVYDQRENTDSVYYLVTIKNLNMKYTSMADLKSVYSGLLKKCNRVEWSDNISYELDQQSRLHIHTYCASKYKLYMNRLKVPNFTVNLVEFPKQDMDKVISYINKGSQNPAHLQQLAIESQYYNCKHSGLIY